MEPWGGAQLDYTLTKKAQLISSHEQINHHCLSRVNSIYSVCP